MTMVSAIPDPLTASVTLNTNYAGVGKATTWRYVNGVPTEVRGFVLSDSGQEVPPDRDFEAPLGVVVGYANALWTTTKPTPPALPEVETVLNVPDTQAWIKFPAYPHNNFAIDCVTQLPQRKFDGNVGRFRVLGRKHPIAVHDVMTSWSGKIEWLCPSGEHHDFQVQAITSGAIMMLQTMPAYGSIREYISANGFQTAHALYAQTKTPQRSMELDFQTTDEPVGPYTVQILYTYTKMLADWATYTVLATKYRNYYSLLRDIRI